MTTPLHLQFVPVAQALLFTLLAPFTLSFERRDFPEGTQEGPVRSVPGLTLCRGRASARPADLKVGHYTTPRPLVAADGKVKKGFTNRVE
jgi:hypothetical protein